MQIVHFEFNGPHQMGVPDGDLNLLCARDIIEGHSYPLPVKDDFEVRNVVDLGAHAGEFTVMAGLRWPEATIVAYEPQAEMARLCSENCRMNGISYVVCNQAVNDKAGKFPLYYSDLGTVASSLFPGKDAEGNTANAHQMVQVIDARDLLDYRPDVLKLDVEGAEVNILRRIKDYLPNLYYIYIEFHHELGRLAIEDLLLKTHQLAYARIPCPNQGEVMYRRRK